MESISMPVMRRAACIVVGHEADEMAQTQRRFEHAAVLKPKRSSAAYMARMTTGAV
jgi:hypothetical protein